MANSNPTPANFPDQIASIVAYARRVNYNPETGDVMDLVSKWLRNNELFYDAVLSDVEGFLKALKKSF